MARAMNRTGVAREREPRGAGAGNKAGCTAGCSDGPVDTGAGNEAGAGPSARQRGHVSSSGRRAYPHRSHTPARIIGSLLAAVGSGDTSLVRGSWDTGVGSGSRTISRVSESSSASPRLSRLTSRGRSFRESGCSIGSTSRSHHVPRGLLSNSAHVRRRQPPARRPPSRPPGPEQHTLHTREACARRPRPIRRH